MDSQAMTGSPKFLRPFDAIDQTQLDAVGGKGLSLGLLARAGLPVPPGFCILTSAYRDAAQGPEHAVSPELQSELADAYRRLGEGLVAVRSSAIGEDGEAASFAGQQETLLGVHGMAQLTDAVQRCWRSLHSDRAQAYRQKQNAADQQLAMAVVVQRLVPSEVSGVLFTRDPLDATGQLMLVEAAWGLGEGVVSGKVSPDRYHLDRDDGRLAKQEISTKSLCVTLAGDKPLSIEDQNRACLDAGQLRELCELGKRIEQYYGGARDVEWAWAEGKFWILQARPITSAGAFEREQYRRQEIATLQAQAEPRGTVWAKYNLAEILTAPTPMTWAIVRRFMSGRGGYGQMLRDLGFDPDPIIDVEGFIDLVCGRPYVNLSREPKLYFRDFPSGHSFQALKANPEKAFYPQPAPQSDRVTARFLIRVPLIFWRMLRNAGRLRRQSETCAEHLRQHVFPRFRKEVEQEHAVDLGQLSPDALVKRLHDWIDLTLNQFARQSLQPSVFATVAMGNLEQALKKSKSPEEAAATVRAGLGGVHPEPEADLAGALQQVAAGEMTAQAFLHDFGHRGPQEMELSQPRWRETPELILTGSGERPPRREPRSEDDLWQEFVQAGRLPASRVASLREEFRKARLYTALRETAKHHLMMGYAHIRRVLLALGDRFHLRDGVFFLTPDELPRLIAREDLSSLIARRQQERSLALSLEVPPVLFSDDLDAIGRPIPVSGAKELRGTPLSAGVIEGPVLVLEDPHYAPATGEGFILVCPSTDPAWVPLFLRAQGLVMETGGVLSHGAIVAREFGLPAVAGLPNIQRQLRTGQRVRVDGNTGRVHVFE
jgi:pyruvate,water dikinase